jgi:NAD(P)-dependent dehydrogenase (short-subunit alcohol dehydrogenase family)
MSATPPDKDGIGMLWWAAHHPPADPKISFDNKTVLITGANVGLGYESALKFASLGASSMIFGVRSLQRGGDAKATICERTGYNPANIKLYQLDMSTFASVESFARTVSEEVPQIDIVVLNAGMAAAGYNVSPEGYEMSLQVNVLSTALLAICLLPRLRETAGNTGSATHLELVGSAAHHDVKLEALGLSKNDSVLAKVSRKDFFNVQVQYGVTKLLLMYVMQGLAASSLKPGTSMPEVIVTTVCPGLCRSNLGRDFPFLLKIPVGLFQHIFARSSEEGSRTMVSGTTLGPEAHGEFWSHDVLFK